MKQINTDKKFLWSIYLTNNNQVMSISMIALKEFNEEEQYTDEDVIRLDKILKEEQRPIWSEDQWTLRNQIKEYSQLIRSKLKTQ